MQPPERQVFEAIPSIELYQHVGARNTHKQNRNAGLRCKPSLESLESRNRRLRRGQSANTGQHNRRYDGYAPNPMNQRQNVNHARQCEIIDRHRANSKTRSQTYQVMAGCVIMRISAEPNKMKAAQVSAFFVATLRSCGPSDIDPVPDVQLELHRQV